MKTILLATDFSEGSVNADRHAKKLAKKTGSSIIYFHALSPPVMDINVPAELADEIYRTTNDHFEHELKKLAKEGKKNGISCTYVLSLSDLVTGISEVAEEKNADLIIIGKTGNPGFLGRILGSTAGHLIHKFSKPLLIIPENTDDNIFRHILYATRLESDEIGILKEVYELKRLLKAKMTLSKVDEENEPDIHNDKDFEKDIHANFPKSAFEIIHEKSTDFIKGIEAVAKRIDAGLLVVTTSERGLLEGLVDPGKSKKLVAETSLPVLVYNI